MAENAIPHWEHFPHEADMGVRGHGASREQAFEQAALALTAVIADLDKTPRISFHSIRATLAGETTNVGCACAPFIPHIRRRSRHTPRHPNRPDTPRTARRHETTNAANRGRTMHDRA